MIDDAGWTDTLTAREAECLRLVLELHTNDAIARRLDLSTNTVRNHMQSARGKLGGLGRYEAARRYVELTGDAGHSWTSRGRTMVAGPPIGPDPGAARPSGGPGQSEFHETRAAYTHDDLDFEASRHDRGERVDETSATLLRLLAVPAGAAIIALLIVATPPMAESFKRLAEAIAPLFR